MVLLQLSLNFFTFAKEKKKRKEKEREDLKNKSWGKPSSKKNKGAEKSSKAIRLVL